MSDVATDPKWIDPALDAHLSPELQPSTAKWLAPLSLLFRCIYWVLLAAMAFGLTLATSFDST